MAHLSSRARSAVTDLPQLHVAPTVPPAGEEPAAAAAGRAHSPPQSRRALAALAFAALGVVYGDIGTSPLYALKACFGSQGVAPTPENVYGVLSLVFWALVLVISVWYLGFILRADNRGEGGILSLMALATSRRKEPDRLRRYLILLGLFGTALLYGDGIITPAISVLGAVEGLEEATPALEPFVIPLSVAILVALFAVQRRGTAGVAKLFSPVTLIWFLSIASLGLAAILRQPQVLAAVNPLFAVRFFAANGVVGFLVLGFVFLVVTGGEALYADLGHFGRPPIRFAWFVLVLPALLLNYFGQGALLLSHPEAAAHPFYRLVPGPLLYPMVGLATAAAVVASQAVISSAFSLTRQALQLGYAPRLTIVHTSKETVGQIFVPSVNRILLIACIGLVVGFRSTENLAAAYGIAVSATMAMTSLLFIVVAVTRLGWSPLRAALLGGFFIMIDFSFFSANIVKIVEGGWFPVSVAAVVYLLMTTWRRGVGILAEIGRRGSLPLEALLEDLGKHRVPRVAGAAVFMSNAEPGDAPLVLLHHLKHNKVLHERVALLTIRTEEVPVVPDSERVVTRELEPGFYQVIARYGYMETPNAPRALARSEPLKRVLQPATTTYYLGRVTLIPTGSKGMALWRKKLFRFMARNALRPTAYFGVPPNRVVELGAQVQF
jgi:KUP system potassium uptake protein